MDQQSAALAMEATNVPAKWLWSQPRLRTALLAITAAALAGCASFGPTVGTSLLFDEASRPGESLDAFVIRIAPRALAETLRLHAEVCSEIMATPDGWRVSMTTDHSPYRCSFPADARLTVHTHLPEGGFTFSRQDFARSGYLITQVAVKFQDGGRVRKVSSL